MQPEQQQRVTAPDVSGPQRNDTANSKDRKAPFYHLQLDNFDTKESLAICRTWLENETPRTLYFINAHCFNLSRVDDNYLEALNSADLLLNDGIGIRIAASLIGLDLKENMNGTDFIPEIIEMAAAEGKRVFLLGAQPGVATTAQAKINERYGHSVCVGAESGYFTPEEEAEVIGRVDASGAEILVVGMGVPYQEKWLSRNRHRFQQARLLVAGGAIIDFTAARVKRAPLWVQRFGMEWLYRFQQEPVRLFKRYFVGNWIFLSHVVFARLAGRHHPRTKSQR